MILKRASCFISFLFLYSVSIAQPGVTVFSPFASSTAHSRLYAGILKSINNLTVALTDSTEDKWSDAFYGLELIGHTSPWENNRIHYAFDSIEKRSTAFQRALLELVYTNYPKDFQREVSRLQELTLNEKIFAMCIEYLVRIDHTDSSLYKFLELTDQKFSRSENPIIKSLRYRLDELTNSTANRLDMASHKLLALQAILSKDFLPKNILLISIQRKNRDYPGIVLIRDSLGNYLKDETGQLFSVRQLARSLSNLPGYLTDGSTPQGIYRMDGFDISQSFIIGPTTNIQLTMPGETSIKHFMKDSTITDSTWTAEWYARLLPPGLINYFPVYGSFYAGMAGRTEIISHGTTVDPEYYRNKTYYPYTPTEGCLCTKELWDSYGKRTESDQQKLVNALKTVGGANGYCVVIEINDKDEPVKIEEVVSYLPH